MIRFPKFGSTKVDSPETPAPVDPGPPGSTVVLLVDDEPAVRNLFGLALRREGYHVVEANDGLEALGVAHQLPRLDLVVTDIVMPKLKGPAFAAQLRERMPEMKFVFVSGYVVSDDLGPNSHMLAKPFMRQDLVKMVYDVIGPPNRTQPA